jgi:hypothetical protein
VSSDVTGQYSVATGVSSGAINTASSGCKVVINYGPRLRDLREPGLGVAELYARK